MLGAIEKRFGDKVPEQSIQWLTDNGSAYRAHETHPQTFQVVTFLVLHKFSSISLRSLVTLKQR